MRGKRAKRLRRQVANEMLVEPYNKRAIRVGRAYGGPALGAFPYPPSRREGEYFDVITADLETIRQHVQSAEEVNDEQR